MHNCVIFSIGYGVLGGIAGEVPARTGLYIHRGKVGWHRGSCIFISMGLY